MFPTIPVVHTWIASAANRCLVEAAQRSLSDRCDEWLFDVSANSWGGHPECDLPPLAEPVIHIRLGA